MWSVVVLTITPGYAAMFYQMWALTRYPLNATWCLFSRTLLYTYAILFKACWMILAERLFHVNFMFVDLLIRAVPIIHPVC
jgi:hypothetical protein